MSSIESSDNSAIQNPSSPAEVSSVGSSDGARSEANAESNTSTADASASTEARASSADVGDVEGDDAGDGESGDAGEEGGAQAADGAGAEGDGKKKKRRRRRKKKTGATPEGGEQEAAAAAGPRPEGKPKRKRDDRERPAFSVGDVVFGKILEIGEDAIFVDLSGKGTAIFDKLELILPEDHAAEIERMSDKAEAEADAIMTGREGEAAPSTEGAEGAEASADVAAGEESAEDTLKREARIVAPRVEEEVSADASQEGETSAVAATPESTEAAPAEAASTEAASTETAEGTEATEGEAPKTESLGQVPKVVLEPGAAFVAVVHNDGGRGGNVVLTHHPKRGSMAKPALARAFKEGAEIYGLVTGTIKGGVEVDVDGVRAFAPGSHMDLRLGANLHHVVGKRLPFKVTQYGKRGRDVVLSRKEHLEAGAKEAREKALATLKVGEIFEGTVRSIVSFGAFIDLGGVEGLVSLSEMSHNRSDGPSDVFKPREKVSVKILKIDEKGKIYLSRKATIADPWGAVKEKYAIGTKHMAKVVRIQDFGAFVELESGVDGLIHTIDLAFKRPEHANEVVKIGDEIEVVVAHLDAGSHKIGLHPALTGAQAEEAA